MIKVYLIISSKSLSRRLRFHKAARTNKFEGLSQKKSNGEDWSRQFFAKEESVKVKNLSDLEMDEAVIAFLSLGSKFCPVDLDLDRKQKGDEIDAWIC